MVLILVLDGTLYDQQYILLILLNLEMFSLTDPLMRQGEAFYRKIIE